MTEDVRRDRDREHGQPGNRGEVPAVDEDRAFHGPAPVLTLLRFGLAFL